MKSARWEDMLKDYLRDTQEDNYRDDIECAAAKLESMESTIRRMLEKLRDDEKKTAQ
jgi:hypothetical protein